jgi:hypothetical protein
MLETCRYNAFQFILSQNPPPVKSGGRQCLALAAKSLSLTLFVLGILANDGHATATANHFALFANFLDGGTYLHECLTLSLGWFIKLSLYLRNNTAISQAEAVLFLRKIT